MKKLFSILVLIFFHTQTANGQLLNVDSTRFMTGIKPSTEILYAIPTSDKGILFVGNESGHPGGIIPYLPVDTILSNVFIGKIDSNQQISWLKVYGGSQDDGGGPVCQTPDGGYAILAGTTSHDGNVTGFKGGSDIWLLRLDALGNLLWEKTYGSTQSDGPISIANTPDHGFIILGTTNGNDGDVPFHYGSFFSQDWVVIKTDTFGDKQWSKDIGGIGNEQPSGSILSIGNCYYIVSSSSSNDHDCVDSTWHGGVNTLDDYHLLKLDDTGKVLWDSSYGGSGDDEANYAFYDVRDNTIVIAGSTSSNDYMVTEYHLWDDMWVVKLDTNGKFIWQRTLGSTQQETGTGICAAKNGGYIAYCTTFPGGGVPDPSIHDIGVQDCWLFALDNSGNEVVGKVFGGTGPDNSKSIVPYLNGYVATGNSGSTVFSEGSCNINYSGAFASYINYWPLSVNSIGDSMGDDLTVYPNPSQNSVRIKLPQNKDGELTVINNIGQIVYSKKGNVKYTDISIDEWANGIYIVKWQGVNGMVLTKKMIKI